MTDLSKEKIQLDEIENQVKNIIIKTLKIQDESKIKKDTKFVDDLGADSLDQIELIMAVEDEYDVQIPDEEVEKIKTVQNVIDYILENTDKK